MQHTIQELKITGVLNEIRSAIKFVINMTLSEKFFKQNEGTITLGYYTPKGKNCLIIGYKNNSAESAPGGFISFCSDYDLDVAADQIRQWIKTQTFPCNNQASKMKRGFMLQLPKQDLLDKLNKENKYDVGNCIAVVTPFTCEFADVSIEKAEEKPQDPTNCPVQKITPRYNDLTGRQFNFLKAIKKDESIKDRTYWLCECECGNIVSVYAYALTSGAAFSCGCKRRSTDKKSLKTIIYKGEEKPVVEWCRIMNMPVNLVSVRLNKLHWSPEKALETPPPKKKNVARSDRTRIRGIWRMMHARCEKPNTIEYDRYGGRGIKVCPEWDDFETFYTWALNHGYQSDLSIDRKNNDGNYSPDNCRWATQQEQRSNTSANHYITCGDDTHTITEWGRIVGIDHTIIGRRLKKGMSAEDALTTPVRKNTRKKYLSSDCPVGQADNHIQDRNEEDDKLSVEKPDDALRLLAQTEVIMIETTEAA